MIRFGEEVVGNKREGRVFVAPWLSERHHVEDFGGVSRKEACYGFSDPVSHYRRAVPVVGYLVGDVDNNAIFTYAEGFENLFLFTVD